ncbi:MAG: hypothetical protein H7256_10995 [Bdellovibrio sp.]|nr:hypothetical protein [Bdellovibrio sp.]
MQDKNVKPTTTDINAAPSKETFKDKAGDVIEKAGHKLSEMGATKVGQKIHDLGDSLEEHHKNPSHPHKV